MSTKAFRRIKYSLINITLAALILLLYIAITSPDIQAAMGTVYGRPYYRGTEKNMIALQCAVTWNASSLDKILDELKADECHITFFVSGEWAEENDEKLLRIAQDGHEIGTMGMKPFEDGDIAWLTADIADSAKSIKSICGVEPKLYYSGTRNLSSSSRAASKLDMIHVLCTVDLLCARGTSADILQRALDSSNEGNIILIQPTAGAAEALPAILEAYRGKDLEVSGTGTVLGFNTR
jgi:peptidoglycan/xylan/chitin deacetylase (PgdA/CDA1 family)